MRIILQGMIRDMDAFLLLKCFIATKGCATLRPKNDGRVQDVSNEPVIAVNISLLKN